MIKVLLAEDEPAAARYLESLVDSLGGDFAVVGVAENGVMALEMARERLPDILLTDVRMPVMGGIELLERMAGDFPSVKTAIVSVYQEFEYARKALSLGVGDYLLKPVDPEALRILLEKFERLVESRNRDEFLVGLERAIAGQAPGDNPEGGCIEGLYFAALLRVGGPLLHSAAPPAERRGSAISESFYRFPGRDANESLLVGIEARISSGIFASLVGDIARAATRTTRTALFHGHSVDAAALSEVARAFGTELDNHVCVGQERIIWGHRQERARPELDPVLLQELRLALESSALNRFASLVREEIGRWCLVPLPARQIAQGLRELLYRFQREGSLPADAVHDWELELEQGMCVADSVSEVQDLAERLMVRVAGLEGRASGPTDAPEAHQRVRRYLQSHFAEAPSLTSICAQFGLSQTYMSKLFRRFDGCSFHEYLTRLRFDAAERLLRQNPDIALKTVADCVGYQDEFHFSRAFKAARGYSPSEIRGRN